MTDWDDAYANGAYIDGAAGYPPRWTEKAQAFRDDLGARAQVDLPYGSSLREVFDLFMPEGGAPKGVVVFVHGGYWRAFDKSVWSHFAAGPLAQGWAVAMPSYDLCPDVQISDITQQIVAAVQVISAQVAGPVSLTGHSAGGHLVARMLDRNLLPSELVARLHHVLPISPLSDLRPLMRTQMNDDFKMTMAQARAESPVLMRDRVDVPVTIWVGGDERPAFVDQARWLGSAWSNDVVIAAARHHFDVIDDLQNAKSDMVRRLTS
jgi:acetyl esterase/lipase